MKTNKSNPYINDHLDITVDIGTEDVDWLNYSGVNTSSGSYNITASSENGYPWGTGSITLANGSNYTTSPAVLTAKGKMTLQGENADLDINGVSLKDFMQRVEQRLSILTPDSRLEAEWEELRALGDRYRELEKEINAKMKTFDILKNE